MVVILAGCDGTGKSTCFDLLRKSINANFIKESCTRNFEKKLTRVQFTLSKILDGDLTIYDRATVLDDLVYDPVMINKESRLMSIYSKDLSAILRRCLIIYFDLDDFELTKRLEDRGDDYVSPYQINKIKHSYDNIFKELGLDPIRLDATGLSENSVYEIVKGVIEQYEEFENCRDCTS